MSRSIEDFCERIRTGLQQATFDQKRKLVELLIDRVIVSDGDVEIRYVMPTCKNSEHIRFCHLHLDYRARSSERKTPNVARQRLRLITDCVANSTRNRGNRNGKER